MEILRVLRYGDDGASTKDESESDVHVVGWNVLGETWPYFRPNFARMKDIMVEKRYEKVGGFVPTGWTYEVKRNKFAVRLFMDIEKLDSKHSDKLRKHFCGLVDEMANKKDFLMGFHCCENVEKTEMDAITIAALNKEKVMGIRQNVSEMKTVKSNDIDTTWNDSSSVHKPDSHDTTIPNEEERQRIIEELWDCLPKWVTRDQILDLISSSRWNIVEAVSNFYERPFRSSNHESVSIHLSQASKSASLKLSVRSNISPGKRKKNTENKSNKKVKSNSKLESSGSKQPTITSFFTKLLADDSRDQFIQIINANESSRNYVATSLEKSQGDINKALDLYYGNPQVNHLENPENLVNKSVQVQSCSNDCPLSKNKQVPEESGSMADSSLRRQRAENVDTNILVSLPPDKYKPIKHACWRRGQPAPYVHLARTFDLVGGQKGKIKATSMLCNMFRRLLALSPEDMLPAVYLCTNKIAADHENIVSPLYQFSCLSVLIFLFAV
ncbi:hypothetical protein DITRI_Ditri11bG0015000 [Diplodiscus trichospermus]